MSSRIPPEFGLWTDTFRTESEWSVPPVGLAFGDQSTPLDEVLANLRDRPDFVPVPVPRLGISKLPAIKAWEPDPRICVIDPKGLDFRTVGSVAKRNDREWLIDPRDQPAWAVLSEDGGVAVVVFRRGKVEFGTLEVTPDPALAKFADFVQRRGEPPWVKTELRRLRSAFAFERCTAVGTLLRLSSSRERVSIESLLRATDTPSSLARAWATVIPPDLRHRLMAEAVQRIEALESQLPSANAMTSPVDWAIQRDDLASLQAVLRLRELGDRLSLLDQKARPDLLCMDPSTFEPSSDSSGFDRLREVHWQEPESWWSALAVDTP